MTWNVTATIAGCDGDQTIEIKNWMAQKLWPMTLQGVLALFNYPFL